jgi:serine/threonine protein kinase
MKEARLLHEINHLNIVKFHSVCEDGVTSVTVPTKLGFLMEYVRFDFSPMKIDQKVSSLKDFLRLVDQFDCGGFEHLAEFIVKDIANALEHLHSRDIVHRDLKPDNVLVSNTHYTSLPENERNRYWTSQPIQVKLTEAELLSFTPTA